MLQNTNFLDNQRNLFTKKKNAVFSFYKHFFLITPSIHKIQLSAQLGSKG